MQEQLEVPHALARFCSYSGLVATMYGFAFVLIVTGDDHGLVLYHFLGGKVDKTESSVY